MQDDNDTTKNDETYYNVRRIGTVKRNEDKTWIELFEQYEEGLTGLDEFSHVTVIYWLDQNMTSEKRDNLLTSRKSHGRNVGVYATHSPHRTNLIAISNCRILSVEGCRVYVDTIDALDDSPVLDLKSFIPYGYFHEDDDFTVPDWVRQLIEERKQKK